MIGRMTSSAAVAGLAASMVLAGCASTKSTGPQLGSVGQRPAETINRNDLDRMLAGESRISGRALDQAVAAAAAHPLGSRENPVRAAMPTGQRAYLRRLRCSNGEAPAFSRSGNYGIGVFGNIIDGYEVDCRAAAPRSRIIFMDMYHRGYSEDRPVSGFTIVSEGGSEA